jgi:hypothetical protein
VAYARANRLPDRATKSGPRLQSFVWSTMVHRILVIFPSFPTQEGC